MSKIKDLSIKTCSIEIKVVQVDGHKMTKATFRQIPSMCPFLREINVHKPDFTLMSGIDILGVVYESSYDSPYLFFSWLGKPFKWRYFILGKNEINQWVLDQLFDQIYIAT